MLSLRNEGNAFWRHALRLVAPCVGLHLCLTSPCALYANDVSESLTKMEIAKYVENPVHPVFERLKGGQVRTVSPTWRDQAHNVDQRGIAPSTPWTGTAGYDTPIAIGDGVFAIIERKPGVAFSLWHLNVKDLGLRHVRAINQHEDVGAASGGFHKVAWYLEGETLKGEFTRLVITKNPKNKSKWDGHVLVGLLDLKTGHVEPGVSEKLTFVSSAERTKELLIKKHTTKLDAVAVDTASAKGEIGDTLARRGLVFDYATGHVNLTADAIAKLAESAESVEVTRGDALENIRAAIELTKEYPTCESIRDLAAQLGICKATVTKDLQALSKYAFDESMLAGIAGQRRYRLQVLAGYQMLSIIAATSDDIRDYVQVAEKSMRLREVQDAALLRSHELLFLRACRKGTVDAFDNFIKVAPIALQVPQAKDFAMSLAVEEVDNAITSAADPDKARETVARGLYTDWRKAFRSHELSKADRCFQLLSQHADLKATAAAVQAQDTQDRLNFEDAMKSQGSQQTEIMRSIAKNQQTQLQVMGDQLAQQREMSATLGVLEQQLGYVSYDMKSMSASADQSARSLELIRNLLE